MRTGVTELRNTWNAARKRHLANAAQTMSGGRGRRHLANAYETLSGRRVITARVTRRGATGAEQQARRTPSGGRVITRPPDGVLLARCSLYNNIQHPKHAELFTLQHKFKALLIMGWSCLALTHPFSPLKRNFVDRNGNVPKWSTYRPSYVPK